MSTTAEEKEQAEKASIRAELLDMLLTKARERIKQKGGMITHDEAMRLVLQEDLPRLRNEMADEIAKDYPVIAERLRSNDEDVRKDGLRMVNLVVEEAAAEEAKEAEKV